MPEHLKLHNRKDNKPTSMPPKLRIAPDENQSMSDSKSNTEKGTLETVKHNDKLPPKPLTIDSEVTNAIKSRRRTGSTGGSSAKEAEIIGKEVKPHSHITISNSNPSNNTILISRERSNNSKNEMAKKKTKMPKNPVDFATLFKQNNKNKKRKSHKGISQSDLSSGTPVGIGNIGPPPISIGFGLPRGRHKKAATAFDYENLNNSFQLDRFRHNTITTTPSHATRRKRKGSKKVRVS